MGRLPYPLAYAPVVSFLSGMYVLGGESYSPEKKNHDIAGVLRMEFNSFFGKFQVEENALPPLPKACSYHAATARRGFIYVAASHAKSEKSKQLDTKSFWWFDIGAPEFRYKWQELPPWPGKARYKMAMTSAPVAMENGELREHIFLFSGGSWVKDENGEMDLSKFEYYDDAYRFDPITEEWKQLASLPKLRETREINTEGYRYDKKETAWVPLKDGEAQPENDIHALFDDQPRAAAAAVAMYDRQGRILLFSGSTGRYVTMAVQDRPPFPKEVLAYDIATDSWEVAGYMPEAVVTTGATWWKDQIVIASGEVRPGVRTTKVQALEVTK